MPDCRAFELVSPAQTNGYPIDDDELEEIGQSGEEVITSSWGGFAGTEDNMQSSGDGAASYELARGSSGWTVEPLSAATSQYSFIKPVMAGGASLEASLWEIGQQSAGEELSDGVAGENHRLVFAVRRGGAGGPASISEVGPAKPAAAPPYLSGTVGLVSADTSLEHVLFSLVTSNSERRGEALWPGDTTVPAVDNSVGGLTGTQSLYEYSGTTGAPPVYGASGREPVLVGVSNVGPLHGSPHVNEGALLISQCGTQLGGADAGGIFNPVGTADNAVSEDGETVFFTALAAKYGAGGAHCNEAGQGEGPRVNEVYARLGGAETVAISEPALPRPDCTGVCEEDEELPEDRSAAVYKGASADGRRVFFTTAQPLVNGASGTNLYMDELGCPGEAASCAPAEEQVQDVVLVSDGASAGGAEVQGVVGISEDASHAYFVAQGVLASNSNGDARAGGEFAHAQEGADNLYVWEGSGAEGGEGTVKFVAMLCTEDQASGSHSFASSELCPTGTGDEALWREQPFYLAGTSPGSGEYLAFAAVSDLTADDTSTSAQVFEYHAEAGGDGGRLVRASIGQPGSYICPATGAVQVGYNCDGNTTAAGGEATQMAFSIRQTTGEDLAAARWNVAVAEDGTVAFEGRVALSPVAVEGAVNVYEYRYQEGRAYLLSPPQEAAEQEASLGEAGANPLLGMDRSGRDVFIASSVALVPQDIEGVLAIYDVREGGGQPAPAAPAAPCGASACPHVASGAPQLAGALTSQIAPEAALNASKPKPLTRARKLAEALKACHQGKSKSKRVRCEKQARKKYGPKPKAKAKAKRKRGK
ncbi:MAG TPA: hypothetical protein VGF95_04450 [Solirubrobacteraceae bacterium]